MAQALLPTIGEATASYEAWLRRRTKVVAPDLERKHVLMRDSLFGFLRATYYRWAQIWPSVCPAEAKAPHVVCVGDLHVENFGTWRDAEGRLAWGVNDFDEAARLAYTNDLVRLASSALLAARSSRIELSPKAICDAILAGYQQAMRAPHGQPVILAERHRRLGECILARLVKPKRFWKSKLGTALRSRPQPPPTCRAALRAGMPPDVRDVTFHARVAGLGSLGRQRYVAVAEWHGGRIAREAKAGVSPATCWAAGRDTTEPNVLSQLLWTRAVRSRDPHLALHAGWIVRRLAPDSDKTTFATLDDLPLELEMVGLMGCEIGNVHLATHRMKRAILADLQARGQWLRRAAERMAEHIEADHAAWRQG